MSMTRPGRWQSKRLAEIARATAISDSDLFRGWRHIAFITKGKKILSIGKNRRLPYYPGMHAYRLSVHAEEDALSRAHSLPRRASMYVFRVHYTGKLGMSKPCATCRKLLREYGIHEVWFSTPSGKLIPLVNEEENVV